jgi:hypothetical protein
MPRPKPEFERGHTVGCWTVLRVATPQRGRRRYLCKSTCCGTQRILRDDYLRRAPPACVHCKGNGQRAVRA